MLATCHKKLTHDTLHPGGPRNAGYATAGLPIDAPSLDFKTVQLGTPRSVQLSRASKGQQEKPALLPFKRQYEGSIAEAVSNEISPHLKEPSDASSDKGELRDEWRTSVIFVERISLTKLAGHGKTLHLHQSLAAKKSQKQELGRHWLTNPHVLWRHPIARIVVAFLVLGQDVFLYAEDPVNDSHVEANLPGIGHIMSFLFTWPSGAGPSLVRVALLVLAVLSGVVVGRQVIHHRILRDCFKLSMFSDCNGTLFVITITGALNILIASVIYNIALSSEPQITGATGMELRHFCKLCQICSVTADIVAILMIWDSVFQDRDIYPKWGRYSKHLWNDGCRGCLRVVFFWVAFVGGLTVTVVLILKTGKGEDDLRWDNRGVGGLTEVGRALLVSGILTCDLLTVLQDWAFPTFQADLTIEFPIKVAGAFTEELRCSLLSWIARKLWPTNPAFWQFFTFSVTGKWMTYGPLMVVVCLDLFCVRMQMIYDPQLYGQYVDPQTHRVWTITDKDYLQQAYNHGNLEKPEMIAYSARWNTTTKKPLSPSATTDIELNSQYMASPFKWVAAVPGLAFFVFFLVIAVYGNRTYNAAMERAARCSTDTSTFRSIQTSHTKQLSADSGVSNHMALTDGSKAASGTAGVQELVENGTGSLHDSAAAGSMLSTSENCSQMSASPRIIL